MPARSLNLGILAHVDAGKTTLTERLLHRAGVIDRPGSVDSGTTQTDSLALERRRGITIRAAVVSFPLGDLTVNVVDTPGHPDFIAEVERSLAVLDGAVLVLSAVEGVQPQTRILMRALQRLEVPTLLFVNKVDRVGADLAGVLESVTRRLSPDVLLMGEVRDLGTRAAAFTAYGPDDRGFRDREALALAEHDDAALTAYVEGRARPVCDLSRDLATQTAAGLLHPVYAGSAATGAGVPDLMVGIADLLPVPDPDPALPPSGRVFKIERGAAGEKVAYVRMFTGAVGVRQRLDLPEGRVGKVAGVQLFQGGHWVRAQEVGAGQIGRLHGLAPIRVGDSFGVPGGGAELHFAPPTLEASVAAVRPEQEPALRAALAALADQDPLIDARGEQEGSVVVSLYGRVQQEVLAATLAEEYAIETVWADARVLHVERPRRTARALEVLNTPSNPYGATVGLRITPTAPGSGLTFELDVPARGIPLFLYKSAEAFAAVMERHVARAFEQGLRGWQVTDCRVTLTDVAYASWDGPPSTRGDLPTALDYRKLTPLVLRRALAGAGTRVCEPMLHVSLEVPTETTPALQRLLGRWGAELTDQAARGDLATLDARLPAARLHDLQRQLPDLTGGEGVLESRFDGYQPVRGPAPARRQVSPAHR